VLAPWRIKMLIGNAFVSNSFDALPLYIFLFLILMAYVYAGIWNYKELRKEGRSFVVSLFGAIFWLIFLIITVFIIIIAHILKIDLNDVDQNTGGT
jgi:hypothetical protein